MGDCRHEKRACLYAAGMLERGERERFEKHIADCGHCGRIVERERAEAAAYKEIDAGAAAPEGLEDRVIASLRRREARQTNGRDVLNGMTELLAKRLVPAAACLAIILFAAVFFSRPAAAPDAFASSGFSYVDSQLTDTELELLTSESADTYYSLFDYSDSI